MGRWVCGLAVDGQLVVGRCSVALTKPEIKCLQKLHCEVFRTTYNLNLVYLKKNLL